MLADPAEASQSLVESDAVAAASVEHPPSSYMAYNGDFFRAAHRVGISDSAIDLRPVAVAYIT